MKPVVQFAAQVSRFYLLTLALLAGRKKIARRVVVFVVESVVVVVVAFFVFVVPTVVVVVAFVVSFVQSDPSSFRQQLAVCWKEIQAKVPN